MTSQLSKRIEKLERRAVLNADEEQRLQVVANAAVIGRLTERIERLEAALHDIASCLTASKVSKTIRTVDGDHSHLVLDAESVQVVGEVCHRLKE